MTKSKLKLSYNELIKKLVLDPNYQINNNGTIITRVNKQGHATNSWNIKPIAVDKRGRVTISYHGKKLLVHRIVFQAFIGDLDASLEINHIDGNPKNNHASNLEQVTHQVNIQHAYNIGLMKAVIGYYKITQEIADEIRRQVAQENKRACDLAKKYSLSKSTLSYILNNKTWKNKT